MNIDYSQASQEVQIRHFFVREEPAHANFHRFFSADPRFPFSVIYPEALEPFYNDKEYMNVLYATFGKGAFGVIRANIAGIMEARDQSQPTSQTPLSTSPQIDQMLDTIKNWSYRAGSFEVEQPWQIEKSVSPIIVGESSFQASHLMWRASESKYGEGVVFQSRLSLWTIFRNSMAHFSADDFNTILRSFRFLDEAFFHTLGVRWSYGS